MKVKENRKVPQILTGMRKGATG